MNPVLRSAVIVTGIELATAFPTSRSADEQFAHLYHRPTAQAERAKLQPIHQRARRGEPSAAKRKATWCREDPIEVGRLKELDETLSSWDRNAELSSGPGALDPPLAGRRATFRGSRTGLDPGMAAAALTEREPRRRRRRLPTRLRSVTGRIILCTAGRRFHPKRGSNETVASVPPMTTIASGDAIMIRIGLRPKGRYFARRNQSAVSRTRTRRKSSRYGRINESITARHSSLSNASHVPPSDGRST